MLKVIGFGLAIISAACTAHWLYDLSIASMGIVAAVVAAVSGLLLEAAKFSLVVDSTSTQPGITRVLRVVCVTLLMLTSMGATYLYLDRALSSSAPSTKGLELMRSELVSLDRQIEQMQTNASKLSDMVYITKAQGVMRELEPVRERRAQVAAQLAREEKREPPQVLREYAWLIFGLVAVLVDVVGALCLMPVHQIAETQVVKEETPFDPEDAARAKRMILDRGLKPTVSALNKVLHIEKQAAVSILRHLVDDGVLVQCGRNNRYAVAEAA